LELIIIGGRDSSFFKGRGIALLQEEIIAKE
jgi:hypothetical protein